MSTKSPDSSEPVKEEPSSPHEETAAIPTTFALVHDVKGREILINLAQIQWIRVNPTTEKTELQFQSGLTFDVKETLEDIFERGLALKVKYAVDH